MNIGKKMFNFLKVSTLLIFILFNASTVFAQITEYPLLEIKSEPEGDLIHELILGLDDQSDIVQLIRRSSVNEDVFDAQLLIDGEEIVLAQHSGKDALIMSCTSSCTSTGGGGLTIKYLYNGIWNTYRYGYFDLVRTGDDWEVYTEAYDLIYNLWVRSKLLWGMVIGIESIEVNAY